MGIKGLLQLLSPVSESVHISSYSRKTIGIDASCWLHRSTYTCAYELSNNIVTYKYIVFLQKLLNILLQYNIQPYVVFDGQSLPAKSNENQSRSNKRQQYKLQADQLMMQGNRAGATELYQRCVSINSTMTRNFIELCKSLNIKYIVAHNEADSQLTYLYKHKLIDCVMSEDSDLLCFGVSNLLTKFELSGQCKQIDLSNQLNDYTGNNIHILYFKKLLQLQHSTDNVSLHDILIECCILSGCDYLDSPGNIGIKKSLKLFAEHYQRAVVFNKIKQNKSCTMILNYEKLFDHAVNTFKYQYVIDPITRTTVHLNNPTSTINDTTTAVLSTTICDKENNHGNTISDDDSICSVTSFHDAKLPVDCRTLLSYIGVPLSNDLVYDYMRGKLCSKTLQLYQYDSNVLNQQSIKLIDNNGQLPPPNKHSSTQPVVLDTQWNSKSNVSLKRAASDNVSVMHTKHVKHSLDVPVDELNYLFNCNDNTQVNDTTTHVHLQDTVATTNPFVQPRSSKPLSNTRSNVAYKINNVITNKPAVQHNNTLLSYFSR